MSVTRRKTLLILVTAALTVAAALPRFYHLGALSFYGDEDITALVAQSVNAGHDARLPSGMEYRRALPFTWMAAVSAGVSGAAGEAAYRLPSAVLGTLTVPLLFLFGRWLIGTPVALVSALLLAFSEWHLAFSRYARMYAPFLFFYLATAFALLAWSRTGQRRYALLALPLFGLAATLHLTGMLVVLFAVVPLLWSGFARARASLLLACAAAGTVGTQVWERFFVLAQYAGWTLPRTSAERAGSAVEYAASTRWLIAFVVIGVGLGLWSSLRCRARTVERFYSLRELALDASALAAGGLFGAGQLYGGTLAALVFLLVHPWPRNDLIARAALPTLLLLIPTAAASYLAWTHGTPFTQSEGWRALLAFPRPYGALLFRELPGISLLFGVGAVLLALRAPRSDDYALRVITVTVLLSLAAIGLSERGLHLRYAFAIYPLLLLGAAATLITITTWPQHRLTWWTPRAALATALVIAGSGVLGQHGVTAALRQAKLAHGQPVSEALNGFSFRPDHAAAGEFVRRNRSASDVVIAEDPLMQRWYAGPIDYWFRRYGDARVYLYRAPDGQERDHYVGSAIAANPQVVDSIVARANARVWLITSGETAPLHSWYLTAAQSAWLDSLVNARAPVFVGRDRATRVFCLNCAPPTP
jgi:4-amino-4-deoxy-L-arabinose transferase-like glycosyltransferase